MHLNGLKYQKKIYIFILKNGMYSGLAFFKNIAIGQMLVKLENQVPVARKSGEAK